MKNKLFMIGSIVAVGLIATAGYSASATYEKANLEAEDAVKIVEETYAGDIVDVDFDHDDGKPKYEVEYTKDNKRYEVDIDATDGKVIKNERDDHDRHESKGKDVQKANKKNDFITAQEAIDIALQKKSGFVKEVEFDHDDGRYEYEVEIQTKQGEYEIEIDAVTGEVLKVELDD